MERVTGQRFLVMYSGALTLVVGVIFLGGFTEAGGGSARFDTLTVQRINVVEPDGTLRLVLTNNNRVPGPILHRHEYPDRFGRKESTTAGLFFYDAQGTESGGLTFGGRQLPDGTKFRFGHFSFDRYDQDQMFAITAEDDGTNHGTSIRTIDQPNWPLQEYLQLLDRIQNLPPEERERLEQEFFKTHPGGKGIRALFGTVTRPNDPARSANFFHFRDGESRDRLRLNVDGFGKPVVDFLNEGGEVTYKIPPQN